MMTPFARLATTLTLSLGLALSPFSAAPAKADDKTAAIVATLLGLAVVGVLIDKHNDDRRDRPDRVDRSKFLPGKCLRYFRTAEGGRKYMGGTCLLRNYAHADSLPRRCQTNIQTYNRRGQPVWRTVYRQGCLINAGYRIAGR